MSLHLVQNASAAYALETILASQPDPTTLNTMFAGQPHGFAFLSVVHGLRNSGMSPLDILFLIPTIIQLIQQLQADVAAVIAAIKKLRGGA